MPPKIVKEKKKAWTTIHQEIYIWLYNYMTSNYDNIEKDSYIDMNKRELMGIIEKMKNGEIHLKKVYCL